MNKNRKIFFSIIIPTSTYSTYLFKECLPALNRQKYKGFEVILLPDNSSKKDAQIKKKYSWLDVVATKNIQSPAKKRDIGAKHAKGKYLAFIDDDAYPATDWLESAYEHLKNPALLAVCGPGMTPANTNEWEKVFNELLTSRFGSGKLQYRFCPMDARFVRDFPSMNLIVRKTTFKKTGGFGTFYWPGEDSKLCNAITYNNPQSILYTPDIVVFHHHRSSPSKFLRQHGQYGYHRGLFFVHGDLNSREAIYLAPTIFLFYLAALTIGGLLALYNEIEIRTLIYASVPLYMYLGMISYITIRAMQRGKGVIFGIRLATIAVAMHLVYGWMFVVGVIDGTIHDK